MHGKGILTTDGDIYSGDFFNNLRHGYGKIMKNY